jgi:hypothetical protein
MLLGRPATALIGAMTSTDRKSIIEQAVRAAAEALFARDQTVAQVLAAVAEMVADGTPRERAAAVRESRREKMVVEVIRLEQEGRGREAPMLVARKNARDPRDPVEIASLARNIRRWRQSFRTVSDSGS